MAAPALKFNWDDKAVKPKWEAFMKFGNADAKEMTGKNFDKWLKDAAILDGKSVTTAVTSINFAKVTGPKKKTASYAEAKQVLERIAGEKAAKSKKAAQDELDQLTAKLAKLDAPSTGTATKPNEVAGVYKNLTDTSKYTGSHKERFDESGKGKGTAGRTDEKGDGYVKGYKHKDTYEKK